MSDYQRDQDSPRIWPYALFLIRPLRRFPMSLHEMLRSEEMRVVQAAMAELAVVPADDAISALELLSRETRFELRCRAIDGMKEISPERAEPLALQFLHDPDFGVRLHAVHALYELASVAAVPVLAQLLTSDPEELVRSWAAMALGSLGGASEISFLETAAESDQGTDHEGVPIRETALVALKMIRARLGSG